MEDIIFMLCTSSFGLSQNHAVSPLIIESTLMIAVQKQNFPQKPVIHFGRESFRSLPSSAGNWLFWIVFCGLWIGDRACLVFTSPPTNLSHIFVFSLPIPLLPISLPSPTFPPAPTSFPSFIFVLSVSLTRSFSGDHWCIGKQGSAPSPVQSPPTSPPVAQPIT